MEIKILKNVMHANKKVAESNRAAFKNKKILAINIMASPGAGKTSVIKQLINNFKDILNIFVIEGDIAGSIDAQKIEAMGVSAVQINTGGGCHLDANMIATVLNESNIPDKTLLLIENVGNLVCPSTFDIGENIKMVIASAAEGDDKPYKYVPMFECADFVILNKIDIIEHIEFNHDFFYSGIKAISKDTPVFEVSCRTGEGIEQMVSYVKDKLKSFGILD